MESSERNLYYTKIVLHPQKWGTGSNQNVNRISGFRDKSIFHLGWEPAGWAGTGGAGQLGLRPAKPAGWAGTGGAGRLGLSPAKPAGWAWGQAGTPGKAGYSF
jgi:hypothetical protein